MNTPDPTGRQLASLRTAMIDGLDSILDVDAGLRDVLIEAHRARLNNDLANALDLAMGLRAIVPTASQRSHVDRDQKGTPASSPAYSAHAIPRVRGAVAGILVSLDTPTRLAIRSDRALDALGVLFALARARARTSILTLDLSLASDFGRELDLDLVRDLDLDLARDLARLLDPDRVPARVRPPDLTREFTRILDLSPDGDPDLSLARKRVRAVAVALALALDLLRDQVRDLVRACDLFPNFSRVVDLDLNFARDLARARARDLAPHIFRFLDPLFGINASFARALASTRDLVRDLARARDDFTTADFRGIDLTRISLEGLRWSSATTWPSEHWKNQALLASIEIEPGLYEIHGGTTNVPTHAS